MDRRTFITATTAALLGGPALAGCSVAEPDQDETPTPGGAVVATAFGDVAVPAAPARVVALGWGDAETALALGVQPVGASDWLAFGGDGVGPWLDGAYSTPPQLIGTLEPEFEKIAGLAPDVILDTRSSGDPKRYETLAKIAPTVGIPTGGEVYNTPWRTQVRMVAETLGVAGKGDDLVRQVEDALAGAARDNPGFAGKTATVGALSGNGYGVYVTRDSRMQLMAALGFEPTEKVARLPVDSFSVPVSRENLDTLDADLTVIIAIGREPSEILDDPLVRQIPSVRAGRRVTFERDVSVLFSTNTAPSLIYAARTLPPIFADKL